MPKLKIVILFVLLMIITGVSIRLLYLWPGSGFQGKVLWNWIQLLIIPFAVAGAGIWFNYAQKNRDLAIAQNNRDADLKIAASQQQDAVLDAYFAHMSELLLDEGKKLFESHLGDVVRHVAQAHTSTAMRRLNGISKGVALKFLYESQLIGKGNPIVLLGEVDLSHSELRGAYLHEADLRGVGLYGSNLASALLSEADLSAHLREARYRDTGYVIREVPSNLRNCNLIEAVLVKANLTRAELNEANLSRACLIKANLSKANLTQAVLYNADLRGATLKSTDATRADLRKSKLDGADLTKVNFRRANLRHATLSGARLDGANLRGASVTYNQVMEAASLNGATLPIRIMLVRYMRKHILPKIPIWQTHYPIQRTAISTTIAPKSPQHRRQLRRYNPTSPPPRHGHLSHWRRRP